MEQPSASPTGGQAADIVDHVLAICAHARVERVRVSPGRILDAIRALEQVDWQQEEDVRLALRLNLAGNRLEEVAFDRAFDRYWRGLQQEDGDYKPWHPELVRGDKEFGEHRGHDEMAIDSEQFSADPSDHASNLATRWDPDAPALDAIIRELARRLATRPSRRQRLARHGARIDLRRSVRRNAAYGMDLLDLARVDRRTRKTRIVMLCDVSGSMDAFNPFLLQVMFGLQQALPAARTIVFSTDYSEITALLRRLTVPEALTQIGREVRHWSGGTDIGRALAHLNRTVLREGASRSTILVVLSDGYDNGSLATIEREMKTARRMARKIVWINPMYGASTFQVRAAGMRTALPYVDHFLPAFDARSLRVMVRELAQV